MITPPIMAGVMLVKLEKQKLQVASLDGWVIRSKNSVSHEGAVETVLGVLSRVLRLQTVVGKSGVKLFGAIPSFNATIGQTSGCVLIGDRRTQAVPLRIRV